MEKAVQGARFHGERLKDTYRRYERFFPATAFVLGMLVDIFTVGRIDETFNLVQQAVYLLVIGLLLSLELLDVHAPLKMPRLLGKVWPFRDEATHFLLGSLLSAFTIFYFKSSSLVGSFFFFVIIIACLVGNEFPQMRRFGATFRTALFGVCVTSYLFCIVPMLFRKVGLLPFLTSLTISLVMGAGYSWLFLKRTGNRDLVRTRVLYPWAGMIAAFLVLYLCRVIPPVPLSLKSIGIYHDVTRANGGYQVTHGKPRWRFWETGDQQFVARPGDKIFCFFSVFSPGGFHDSIRVRWMFKDPKTGWKKLDAVPVGITGGRDAGFRGFAFKANYQPGDWQVRIETSDALEIGRIYLSVEKAEADETLELRQEML